MTRPAVPLSQTQIRYFSPSRACGYKKKRLFSVRSSASGNQNSFLAGTKAAVKNVTTGIAAVVCLAAASIASAPTFLSWPQGLNAALWVANHTIPGTIHIEKASLGWSKPLQLHDVTLKDDKGEPLLWIQEIVTAASLWSIVLGKSGFGNSTAGPFRINLLEDDNTKLLRLALALEPAQKLLTSKRQPSASGKIPPKPKEPATTVKLSCNVKATNGGLVLREGEMVLPADIAATLGGRVIVDVLFGKEVVSEDITTSIENAFQATMWSDCAHAEAIGFFHPSVRKLKLVKPVKIEMDLTPEMARIVLARVNPLLGYVVGPAVAEDDMPDVSLQVATKDMLFPADEYDLRFQPMKVVLARGPLLDGLLSVLSKDDVIKGKREIKMETSSIQATADTNGFVSCSRLDFLIGGKVHVATWGQVDMVDEKIKMTMAVPSTTLKAVLGLTKVPDDYYLQIPITGTFGRPQLDIKTAGVGIAQVTLHERAGSFARGLLGVLESPAEPVPKPIDDLPWAGKD